MPFFSKFSRRWLKNFDCHPTIKLIGMAIKTHFRSPYVKWLKHFFGHPLVHCFLTHNQSFGHLQLPHIELDNSFLKTYYMLPFFPIQSMVFENFWSLSNNHANLDVIETHFWFSMCKVTETLFQLPYSFSHLWLYRVELNESFPKTHYMPFFF
jgi:hypothetical protein